MYFVWLSHFTHCLEWRHALFLCHIYILSFFNSFKPLTKFFFFNSRIQFQESSSTLGNFYDLCRFHVTSKKKNKKNQKENFQAQRTKRKKEKTQKRKSKKREEESILLFKRVEKRIDDQKSIKQNHSPKLWQVIKFEIQLLPNGPRRFSDDRLWYFLAKVFQFNPISLSWISPWNKSFRIRR